MTLPSKKHEINIPSTDYFRRNKQIDAEPTPETGDWRDTVIAYLTRAQGLGKGQFSMKDGCWADKNYIYTMVLKIKT